MCKYCNYAANDGWTALLEYDTTYQRAMPESDGSNYGFHESWDDLREQVGP